MTQQRGITIHEEPVLESPALLVMLAGWIDAAGAAGAAAQAVENSGSMRTIATFDGDTFIDYRARRPVMELREGIAERIIWPQIELKAGKDAAGRDLLLLTGFEPDANWHFFARLAADVCTQFGTRIMVGLGAYPYATPHTRPSRVSCTTPSAELARSVRWLRNTIDVPAGMEAVLEQAFALRGVPSIGLWVQVPHYISNAAYPAASAALLEAVAETADLSFDISHLTSQAAAQIARLDELVQGNPEHVGMLRQLEEVWDSVEPQEPSVPVRTQNPEPPPAAAAAAIDAEHLPSGDELAEEVERFLREQND